MLAEATLPTVRYDVPIQPRVVSSRPAASRFAVRWSRSRCIVSLRRMR